MPGLVPLVLESVRAKLLAWLVTVATPVTPAVTSAGVPGTAGTAAPEADKGLSAVTSAGVSGSSSQNNTGAEGTVEDRSNTCTTEASAASYRHGYEATDTEAAERDMQQEAGLYQGVAMVDGSSNTVKLQPEHGKLLQQLLPNGDQATGVGVGSQNGTFADSETCADGHNAEQQEQQPQDHHVLQVRQQNHVCIELSPHAPPPGQVTPSHEVTPQVEDQQPVPTVPQSPAEAAAASADHQPRGDGLRDDELGGSGFFEYQQQVGGHAGCHVGSGSSFCRRAQGHMHWPIILVSV